MMSVLTLPIVLYVRPGRVYYLRPFFTFSHFTNFSNIYSLGRIYRHSGTYPGAFFSQGEFKISLNASPGISRCRTRRDVPPTPGMRFQLVCSSRSAPRQCQTGRCAVSFLNMGTLIPSLILNPTKLPKILKEPPRAWSCWNKLEPTRSTRALIECSNMLISGRTHREGTWITVVVTCGEKWCGQTYRILRSHMCWSCGHMCGHFVFKCGPMLPHLAVKMHLTSSEIHLSTDSVSTTVNLQINKNLSRKKCLWCAVFFSFSNILHIYTL